MTRFVPAFTPVRTRALYDLRRMLSDTLRDQLRERHYHWFVYQEEPSESWLACVGLARECIASLRLLTWLERQAYDAQSYEDNSGPG